MQTQNQDADVASPILIKLKMFGKD